MSRHPHYKRLTWVLSVILGCARYILAGKIKSKSRGKGGERRKGIAEFPYCTYTVYVFESFKIEPLRECETTSQRCHSNIDMVCVDKIQGTSDFGFQIPKVCHLQYLGTFGGSSTVLSH